MLRDSEATAPPEFPPEQPEADALPDDEATYGAEDADEDEPEGAEAGPSTAEGEDVEMDGVEEATGAKAEEDNEDAGSEVMSIMSGIHESLANLHLGFRGRK